VLNGYTPGANVPARTVVLNEVAMGIEVTEYNATEGRYASIMRYPCVRVVMFTAGSTNGRRKMASETAKSGGAYTVCAVSGLWWG